jgi:hypothetical protein
LAIALTLSVDLCLAALLVEAHVKSSCLVETVLGTAAHAVSSFGGPDFPAQSRPSIVENLGLDHDA